ncbi:hypothetical protein DMENIID0001_103820 [Sergentomyia squamirostris]
MLTKKKGKVHKYFKELPGNRRSCIFCTKYNRLVNGTRQRDHLIKCTRCPTSIRQFFHKERAFAQKKINKRKLLKDIRQEERDENLELEFLEEDAENVFPSSVKEEYPEELLEELPNVPNLFEHYEIPEEEEAVEDNGVSDEEPKFSDTMELLRTILDGQKKIIELKKEKRERDMEEHELKMKILKLKLELLEKNK